MHCQALHEMYVSVSIHNQTAFNQSSRSHARQHTHITITQRSRACSAPNTQTHPTPRPPTTTQPRLFCAEHPAAAPRQLQQLQSPATTTQVCQSPLGSRPSMQPITQGTAQPQNSTPHPELFCAEHLAAVTLNHELQTTISPRTIRQNSRYSDDRLSAHAANCSAQNT